MKRALIIVGALLAPIALAACGTLAQLTPQERADAKAQLKRFAENQIELYNAQGIDPVHLSQDKLNKIALFCGTLSGAASLANMLPTGEASPPDPAAAGDETPATPEEAIAAIKRDYPDLDKDIVDLCSVALKAAAPAPETAAAESPPAS